MDNNKRHEVIAFGGEVIKALMEYCYTNKITNPKITIHAKTSDGERYKMIFERLDLDKDNRKFEDYE